MSLKQRLCLLALPLIMLAVNCSYAQSKDGGSGEVIMMDKASFMSKVFNYEKNSSEWVYEGTKPCVIDFYADWCGPCRRLSPIMKELAAKYKGEVIFYKIDVDKEHELASVFGVSSIPVILFVPTEGKPAAAMGLQPQETLVEQIDKFLLGKK